METLNVNTEAQASKFELAAYQSFKEAIIETAKENFMRDGELTPVVFIGLENEGELTMGILPAHEFMKDDDGKEMLSEIMKKIGEKVNPVCICMVTEVWFKKADKENIKEAMKLRPSLSPDRQEAIMCSFESENMMKQHIYKIIREPQLGLEEVEGNGKLKGAQGRFVNILKDLKKARSN